MNYCVFFLLSLFLHQPPPPPPPQTNTTPLWLRKWALKQWWLKQSWNKCTPFDSWIFSGENPWSLIMAGAADVEVKAQTKDLQGCLLFEPREHLTLGKELHCLLWWRPNCLLWGLVKPTHWLQSFRSPTQSSPCLGLALSLSLPHTHTISRLLHKQSENQVQLLCCLNTDNVIDDILDMGYFTAVI